MNRRTFGISTLAGMIGAVFAPKILEHCKGRLPPATPAQNLVTINPSELDVDCSTSSGTFTIGDSPRAYYFGSRNTLWCIDGHNTIVKMGSYT